MNNIFERTGMLDFTEKLSLIDEFKHGQFAGKNVKEAIDSDYAVIETWWQEKFIKLTPNALCYMIRVRNYKEGTNKIHPDNFEIDAWELFDDRLGTFTKEKS